MSKKRRKKTLNKKTKGQATYEWLIAKGREFAKNLKKNSTLWEKQFYKTLKDLRYNFQFQVPIICNKKHLYIVDFLLTDFKIFLELDGRQHNNPENKKRDNLRTRRLRKEGYEPLRFTNSQVSKFSKEDIDRIIQTKIKLINSLEMPK